MQTTTWLTATEAAQLATRWRRALSSGCAAVTERTVRSWVARGHLKPTGLDHRGRQVFTLSDVARAERATRERALRLVGIGATSPQGGDPLSPPHRKNPPGGRPRGHGEIPPALGGGRA